MSFDTLLKMTPKDCNSRRAWRGLDDDAHSIIIKASDLLVGWRGMVGEAPGYRIISFSYFLSLRDEELANYKVSFGFSAFYAERFEILNDRKKIVEALVESGILSKDAIEAFADDVPTRVQEPVRDDSSYTHQIRTNTYYVTRATSSTCGTTSGFNYGR